MSGAAAKFFAVGELIPAIGVYQVFHGPHRVTHEVTLLVGELFPRCAVCKDDVHFKLVHAAPQITRDPSFSVHLYEIPHPEEDGAKAVSA